MMKSRVYLASSLLFVISLVLAACASYAPATQPTLVSPTTEPTAVPPTSAPANPPTTGGAANVPTAAATLMVAQDATLGQFLADEKGNALYMFAKDAKNTSNCYDACAQSWPPLLSAGQPQGMDGVNASLLGTTQRKDGSLQVTYNGYPLYYFAADQKPGDIKGQGVKDVWYVLSPSGAVVKPGVVKVMNDAKLGQFLTDDQGRTLYLFTKDEKNVSNCYDACAQSWPPLLSAGQPKGMDGVDAALLGTAQRKDGSMQVTYNDHPLYYFAADQKPGDTNGQGVKEVWYVISPAGEMVKDSTSAAPAAQSTPDTSDDNPYK